MVGLERDAREKQATAAPTVSSATKWTAATALEVAGLRERMDGMSMKLADVDRRVGVLEAARDDDVAPIQNDPSEKSLVASEQSDARATATSPEGERATPAEASGRRPDSSGETSPASSASRADERPRVPVPAPPSVVLTLSDAQFDELFGRGSPPPFDLTEQEPAEHERHGDWRGLRRSAGRRTRR